MPASRCAVYFILLVCFALALSACAVLGGGPVELTPTPIPTSSIPEMQVIPSTACQLAQHGMIRVDNPQGDLISWSPQEDTLVYVAPTTGSSWNVGELNILDGPLFNSPTRIASQVAGEVTWAPDSSAIAYLGLRRSDNLYTVGLAYPDGRASRDLFPDTAARTDDYSSQKSILKWINPAQLRVYVSCGLNCLQAEDIGLLSGLTTPVGSPLERYWDMYAPHTNQPADVPAEFAKLPGQLNWSWDESQVAYIDTRGNLWVVNVESNTLYPLDIGPYGTATETDWSYDGRYLAVQVDQNLVIFSLSCP